MKYYAKCYDDHLAHHGILGQKWGVRRYQNSDGTLTAEGRSRLTKIHDKEIAKSSRRASSWRKDAKNSRQKLSDLEKNGIEDPEVILRYEKLRRSAMVSPAAAQKYRELADQNFKSYKKFSDLLAATAATMLSGKDYLNGDAVKRGLVKEYADELDFLRKDSIAIAKHWENKNKNLMNMDMDLLLNSNEGYKNIKRTIKKA